jgi:hypothetical protein
LLGRSRRCCAKDQEGEEERLHRLGNYKNNVLSWVVTRPRGPGSSHR